MKWGLKLALRSLLVSRSELGRSSFACRHTHPHVIAGLQQQSNYMPVPRPPNRRTKILLRTKVYWKSIPLCLLAFQLSDSLGHRTQWRKDSPRESQNKPPHLLKTNKWSNKNYMELMKIFNSRWQATSFLSASSNGSHFELR